MKNQFKEIVNFPILLTLFVALVFTSCSDVTGPNSKLLSESVERYSNASKNQGITGSALDTNIEDGKQQGKIYVCKFTRTPNNKKGGGEWELLKRGNQGLVHVSPNSIRKELSNMVDGEIKFPVVEIGDWWQDAHTLSIVIDPQAGFDALADRKAEVSIEELCYGVVDEWFFEGDA